MKGRDLPLAKDPVYRVPLAQIRVPAGRARSLKPKQAAAIGAAMSADRQYDPITIARLPGEEGFILVDGLHRLEGARGEGWTEIEARIGPAFKASRTRQEILSGWARAGEDVFDRAGAIREIAAMARDGAMPADADDDETWKSISTALRWDVATAEALGISDRTVRFYVQVLDRLGAHTDMLRRLEVADELVPLVRLARLAPDELAAVLAALEGGSKTIAEAIASAAGHTAQTPETKFHRQVLGGFSRLGHSDRVGAAEALLRQYPAAFEAARARLTAD